MKFDEYIGIDWSGAKSPQASFSIALAVCQANNSLAPKAIPKKLSRSQVHALIEEKLNTQQKVLIGIDCNFAYAASVAQQQFGDTVDYMALWEAIDEQNSEHTNFFAGNTWTQGPIARNFWTAGKQPSWFVPNKLRRHTETASAQQNIGIPESPFKLIGAKQVGKGGLAGMRMLYSLKKTYSDNIAIWPFEQNLLKTANVVVTEIYPRLFIKQAGYGNNKVRDINTLNKILKHFNCEPFISKDALNDHLTDAVIASAGLKWYCETSAPFDIKLPQEAKRIEGWIFGVN